MPTYPYSQNKMESIDVCLTHKEFADVKKITHRHFLRLAEARYTDLMIGHNHNEKYLDLKRFDKTQENCDTVFSIEIFDPDRLLRRINLFNDMVNMMELTRSNDYWNLNIPLYICRLPYDQLFLRLSYCKCEYGKNVQIQEVRGKYDEELKTKLSNHKTPIEDYYINDNTIMTYPPKDSNEWESLHISIASSSRK